MPLSPRAKNLKAAELKAEALFREIEQRGLIRPNITERELNTEIYQLANELFGIKKYWHKRIVRAGPNTLFPYRENPPDLLISSDDIVFLDFGPIFSDWEADFGRTYVLGNDPLKLKLQRDVISIWDEGKRLFDETPDLTASTLFKFVSETAQNLGYSWGSSHCGHLIGEFPHENIPRDQFEGGFIQIENFTPLRSYDSHGVERHWILEVHLTLPAQKIGAFFEQLLSVD
jgi:Xaa-Pro dipeptidase